MRVAPTSWPGPGRTHPRPERCLAPGERLCRPLRSANWPARQTVLEHQTIQCSTSLGAIERNMPTDNIRMYGTTWCQDCKRAKKFLGEHRVPYDFIDVDHDQEGLSLVEETNAGKRIIPTIFFGDGSI